MKFETLRIYFLSEFSVCCFKEQQIEIDFCWLDAIFRRNNSTERVLGCLTEV